MLVATAPSEIISGLRTRCYYFPWVFECTSVYTVYTIYLLLCCLWSHGNPPMHNVINVSAMKFLSNWLWIKKFTLRNFTLAERDNSEKKITIWEGHDVEKSYFFFKNLDFSPKSVKIICFCMSLLYFEGFPWKSWNRTIIGPKKYRWKIIRWKIFFF